MKHHLLFASFIGLASVATYAPPAHACGGCFHPPPQPNEDTSVVTDHRMAFSISTSQTVLWDQIRYSGNPADFAWVLPVGQGATIELARDEWLQALDLLSSPGVYAPPLPARCNSFGGGGGGGGFGCGAASDSVSYGGSNYDDAGASALDSGYGVTVISQEVVGPYVAVTLHSSDGEAISTWLTNNGYDIPTSIQPVLDAYTSEGFDFIALKLAPNQGVNAMQPVRVTTPGADPTLPLRMVAAGIGQSVGLTLYVIGEGRYQSTNFPALTIDRSQVTWDPIQERSNYSQLFDATVGTTPSWVTESSVAVGNLAQLYNAACLKAPQIPVACPNDGGTNTTSDASTDASDDATDDVTDDAPDGATDDAASDAFDENEDDASDGGVVDSGAALDSGSCVDYVSACSQFTDYDTATKSMNAYDIRVTRLRTTLPASALAIDLKLGAGDQSVLSTTIQTTAYSDPNYDPCPNATTPAPVDKEGCGCDTAGENRTMVSTSLMLIALVSLVRRRSRSAR